MLDETYENFYCTDCDWNFSINVANKIPLIEYSVETWKGIILSHQLTKNEPIFWGKSCCRDIKLFGWDYLVKVELKTLQYLQK